MKTKELTGFSPKLLVLSATRLSQQSVIPNEVRNLYLKPCSLIILAGKIPESGVELSCIYT